jgi:NHLM bacteriocin system ABC transporter peptidase/ATP-binding protein
VASLPEESLPEKSLSGKKTQLKNTYVKTPTIYQMESTECGAASLAMILGYYGLFVPLEQMRIESGVSRDGSKAKNVLRAARKFGLEAAGYHKSLENLLEFTETPCIIHWNFNHFVVYEGIKNGLAYLNDPALGRRKLTIEELDAGFTGVVLTFNKTASFQKGNKQKTIWNFVGDRLKGQYIAIGAMFTIGLCLVFPGLVIPAFAKVFVDDILLGGNTSWLPALLLAMLFAILFQAALGWYRGTLLLKLQNKMALISAHGFLSHMLRLPIAFFDQRYAGDLSKRVDNNNSVSTFLAGDLATTVLNLLVAIFYLILMLIYSPWLTLVALGTVSLDVGMVIISQEKMADYATKMQQDMGRMIGALYAGISISSTLKASGAENEYISRILGYNAKTVELEQKSNRLIQYINAIPESTTKMATVLMMMIGGILVIRGQMTAGMLIAFTTLLTSFIAPVIQLVQFTQNINTLKSNMDRVEDIENYAIDPKFTAADLDDSLVAKLSGVVELDDVAFGYNILEPPLIEHFSFNLPTGSSIAFVGASGSGKSTVAKVISGLYLPWTGSVRFDDVPSSRIPPKIMSSSVSTVSQNITLFSGTIRDNLTLWNKSVMERDMVNAAKDSCIHDLITSLPGAYDYVLDEGGTNLSGGQRQRLEIARALVTNPTILIMDEATSALDPILEKQIVDNIKCRGCTCVIVAHRLSAFRDCDQIIVMANGKIVQRGNHETMRDADGPYARLIANS